MGTYYISSGSKNGMYTLRLFQRDEYAYGGQIRVVANDWYLCTLSKFKEKAIQKAHDYLVDIGVDPSEHKLNIDFELYEHAEPQPSLPSDGRMVSGKYMGTHVSELPENYLKWCYLNASHNSDNGKIIVAYLTANGFLDEWYQSGFEIFKRNVLAYYHNIQRCIANDLLVFGVDERNQKLINKNGNFNYRVCDFVTKVSRYPIDYKPTKNEDGEYVVDLVDYFITTKDSFRFTYFLNKIVAKALLTKSGKSEKQTKLAEVEVSIDAIEKNLSNLKYFIELTNGGYGAEINARI